MDPRLATPRPAAGILLAGQDAMEVDEDLPMTLAQQQQASASTLDRVASANPAAYAGIRHAAILTPSPFGQHNAGPTSFRFRNALNRVLAAPQTDTEAWQALMTEVQTSYRSIADVHAVDMEKHIAWVESCYGHLLWHFPYAAPYAVRLGHVLWAQSARTGEEHGPRLGSLAAHVSKRATQAETKLERLLEHLLGYKLDGTVLKDETNNYSDAKAMEENGNEPTAKDDKLPDVAFGMCSWSVDLWLLYVRKVQRDAARTLDAKGTREKTIAAFDLAVSQAGFAVNNQTLWKEYLDFVKSWVVPGSTDHALAQQQMMQLRSVYKRLVVLPMTGLDQFWQEYEAFEKSQSEALAAALIQELQPKYQHARNVYLERNRVYSTTELQTGQRLATLPPLDSSEDDYSTKMEDDHKLLSLWRQRTSYERINPERLTTHELNLRIRSTFKEMAATLTRHIEAWHMWSTWELLVAKTAAAMTDGDSASTAPDSGILQLGQIHIPDSTLLAYAEAEMWLSSPNGIETGLRVMERLLKRNPTTLGFVLYQRMVRQIKGVDAARRVFAEARRTLLTEEEYQEVLARQSASTKEEEEAAAAAEGGAAGAGTTDVEKAETENDDRWMVTNRLDASVGSKKVRRTKNGKKSDVEDKEMGPSSTPAGPVTWHLFASHAGIEHRINRRSDIAARVYELGLRKHTSFLSKPAYVQRYAQLLAELGDTLNLRSLLTKAVAACEQQGNKDALGELWDISLHYESVMAASDVSGMEKIRQSESKRREALMGPEVEDVGTGNTVGFEEAALVGAQKSTIAEQLIRSEGYDTSSRIVNGLARSVDLLGVMGVWGDAASTTGKRSSSSKDDDLSGSRSDKAFQKRMDYHQMKERGATGDAALGQDKGLSARERLQQGTGGSGPMTAMMLSIQQMPEWLRPLLLLLPASRLRIPVVAKPPPHLTEMALSTLKQNDLPAERPQDDANKGSKRDAPGKGGDSSDEEDGTSGTGYSVAFRARQRARMNG